MTQPSNERSIIRIAAALIVDQAGRTLLVRKRGTAAFMQPGGKIAPGETACAALRRELREELGCGPSGEPRPLGRFCAAAANEPGCTVEAELFAVDLDGVIAPAAEIAQMLWYDPAAEDSVPLAPLTRDHVLPLVAAGLA